MFMSGGKQYCTLRNAQLTVSLRIGLRGAGVMHVEAPSGDGYGYGVGVVHGGGFIERRARKSSDAW